MDLNESNDWDVSRNSPASIEFDIPIDLSKLTTTNKTIRRFIKDINPSIHMEFVL